MNLQEDKTMKTLKDFINEVLDISEEFLRRGDHENYQKCIKLIADAVYENLEQAEQEDA